MNMKQDWICDLEDVAVRDKSVLYYEITELLEEARMLHSSDEGFREWLDNLIDNQVV